MTITRVKPSNWVSGEELTYPQINQLDTNVSHALDKTSAGDTLLGIVTLGTGGGITCAGGAGAGAVNGTFDTSSGLTLTHGVTAGSAGGYNYSSRTVIRCATTPIFNTTAAALRAGKLVLIDGGPSSADISEQELDIPHGATLTSVSVGLDPTNATPPAATTPANVGLVVYDTTTGVTTAGASVSDGTTGGSYGLFHRVTLSSLSQAVDRTRYRYFIQTSGEIGPAASTILVHGAIWTATVTSVDQGAA